MATAGATSWQRRMRWRPQADSQNAGWRRGEPWGFEVRLAGLTPRQQDQRPLADWRLPPDAG